MYVPATVYVKLGATAVASSNAPSPSRSHANATGVPSSGSVDEAPLKLTVSGSGPFVRFAVSTAVGGWFDQNEANAAFADLHVIEYDVLAAPTAVTSMAAVDSAVA